MKFKTGDKVKVKYYRDIGFHNGYYSGTGISKEGIHFVREMRKYCGLVFTVGGVGDQKYIKLKNDDGLYLAYSFSEDWLDIEIPKVTLSEDLFTL